MRRNTSSCRDQLERRRDDKDLSNGNVVGWNAWVRRRDRSHRYALTKSSRPECVSCNSNVDDQRSGKKCTRRPVIDRLASRSADCKRLRNINKIRVLNMVGSGEIANAYS
jgi:hypothetical protein